MNPSEKMISRCESIFCIKIGIPQNNLRYLGGVFCREPIYVFEIIEPDFQKEGFTRLTDPEGINITRKHMSEYINYLCKNPPSLSEECDFYIKELVFECFTLYESNTNRIILYQRL